MNVLRFLRFIRSEAKTSKMRSLAQLVFNFIFTRFPLLSHSNVRAPNSFNVLLYNMNLAQGRAKALHRSKLVNSDNLSSKKYNFSLHDMRKASCLYAVCSLHDQPEQPTLHNDICCCVVREEILIKWVLYYFTLPHLPHFFIPGTLQ